MLHIKKYSLTTGLTQSITEIADYFGGAWRSDGTIFFMGVDGAHLRQVRADGGSTGCDESRLASSPAALDLTLRGQPKPGDQEAGIQLELRS